MSCGRDDPHVVGFDGTPFDFHAEHGAVLSLLTTPTLVVNARMSDMGTADGSWMDAVGIKTSSARVAVVAAAARDGTGCVDVESGDRLLFSSCDTIYTPGNATVGDVALWFFVVNDHSVLQARTSDVLVVCEQAAGTRHLDVSFQLLREVERASGVIGQSLAWRLDDGSMKADADEFVVDDDLFGGAFFMMNN